MNAWALTRAGKERQVLSVVTDEPAGEELAVVLDDVCRRGAQRMLAIALEAEVDAYCAALREEVDEDGHRLVVRNGHAERRTITTSAGAVEIEAPRVDDRRVEPHTGERRRFRSELVPPW
jgi:transposase-like protein